MTKPPREYHFGDFWTSTFCPNFNMFSFPFVIWMVNTIVYIGSLIALGFLSAPKMYDFEFLGADPTYMNTLQAMNPFEVRFNYQLWRPFTALFLTSGFQQYCYSTAYLLVFGFMFKATTIKFLPNLIFYLICGAVGNLFGAVCDRNGALFVGCQPGCYAMFAGVTACFIVNWKAMDQISQARCPLIFAFVMLTLLLLLNSSNATLNTNAYHIKSAYADWGGWICGMGLGLVMMPRARVQAGYVGSYEKLCMKMGAVFIIVYWAILFSCYWTVYMPP